jgi:hypothetical protein
VLELVREQRRGRRKDGTILAAVATTKDEHGELIPEPTCPSLRIAEQHIDAHLLKR